MANIINYEHGISTRRSSDMVPSPIKCLSNVTVIIGTAPVNTADDVYGASQKPIAAYTRMEADKAVGTSTEFDKYTILHGLYAEFNKFGTAPVVIINVLDPNNEKHVQAVTGVSAGLTAGTAKLEDMGILLDKLEVSSGSDVCTLGEDYTASFDDDGCVVISATEEGKLAGVASCTCSYVKLNPDGVTAADIIGGIDEAGRRTGMELIDEIYPELDIIPTILTAPGFSKNASVAAALEAKAQEIYDTFNAIAVVDIDSSESGAVKPEDVATVKGQRVVASRWTVAVWPMASVDGYKIWYSAMVAALMHHTAAEYDGIPFESPDNLDVQIDGLVLEDGTPVRMTQRQVNNYINASGVVSALKLPTWKCWGNNTAAYPASVLPLNRWIKCVTMLNYMENTFKTNYLSTVGRNASYKVISDVVNGFNLFMNSLTPDYLAGGSIIFDKRENPVENIVAGHLKFHTRYADYTPAEYIENEFTYDLNILMNALEGGTE